MTDNKYVIRLCPSVAPYPALTLDQAATLRIVGEDRDCDLKNVSCSVLPSVTVKSGSVSLVDLHIRPGKGATGVSCGAGRLRLIHSVVATEDSAMKTAIIAKQMTGDSAELANIGVDLMDTCIAVIDQTHIHSFNVNGIRIRSATSKVTVTNSLISGVGDQDTAAGIKFDEITEIYVSYFNTIAGNHIALICPVSTKAVFNASLLLWNDKNTPGMNGGCSTDSPPGLKEGARTICGWNSYPGDNYRSRCLNDLSDEPRNRCQPSNYTFSATAVSGPLKVDYNGQPRQAMSNNYLPGFRDCP